ncbi:hypothetical protein TRVA0_083S00210 [Trichomonascus vanleenenianus]|uniref:uncharacterized protein n=1 Tax=Trichomonascus vanleenenianus TaxID=2268995 RepID=UPI003ECA5988
MSSSQERRELAVEEGVMVRGAAEEAVQESSDHRSNHSSYSNTGDERQAALDTATAGEQEGEVEEHIVAQGSAIDKIEDSASGVEVTLMLISGQRNKFTIPPQDEKTQSNITIEHFRNALFQSWKDAWGNSPSTPANIRLIHFGKVLEDAQTLEECGITSPHPTVVHVSVKPQSFELDRSKSNSSKSKSRRRSDDDRGSRCCIIS